MMTLLPFIALILFFVLLLALFIGGLMSWPDRQLDELCNGRVAIGNVGENKMQSPAVATPRARSATEIAEELEHLNRGLYDDLMTGRAYE